ncbi:RlpA-like double-psi beta-barrel domain-containing protein [Allokutzneria oryzae]|uniref:RlpA-like double-psi beta-barrel domain-containing protein n=1 Tax=Allokutzneria oryzae TaxID=1378989 RepID=A0ABV5ZU08_9PSEU
MMRPALSVIAVCGTLFMGVGTAPAFAAAKSGEATYYALSGTGACGKKINASTQLLVAVSAKWFTTANPNKDPICKKRLKVTYGKKSITVPVRDKCPSCSKTHFDLSKAAFKKLAGTSAGRIAIKWEFVT